MSWVLARAGLSQQGPARGSCLRSDWESPYCGQPVPYHTSGSRPPSLNGLCLGSPESARRSEFQVKPECQLSFQVKCSSQPGPCLVSLESALALSRVQACQQGCGSATRFRDCSTKKKIKNLVSAASHLVTCRPVARAGI